MRITGTIALVLGLALVGCGKSRVQGLGNPLPDATSPAGDSGNQLDLDASLADNGNLPDTGQQLDGSDPPPPDSGTPDAMEPPDGNVEPPDGGAPDAMDPPDADAPDAMLPPDAGPPDTGTPDGGQAECTIDDDCGFGEHCEQTSLTCVDCLNDTHCIGTAECDIANGFVCRLPCFNGDCGPLGVCDPTTDLCVECLQNADCDGQVCDTTVLECVECAVDADCALQPGHNQCSTNNECVGCEFDADCPGAEICLEAEGGVCAPSTGRGLCLPCTTDSQCGGADDLCIGLGTTGGLIDRTCTTDCGPGQACPDGFDCVSVRGNSAQVCRPRYDMTGPTCRATRHLGAACEFSNQNLDPGCGITGRQDARCLPGAAATDPGTCIVWCVDNTDCAGATTCQSAGGRLVCL